VNLEGKGQAAAVSPKACPSCGSRFPADALYCALDGSALTTSPAALAAAAATDPYVGREILGHIEIRQLVGIGAMGRVYRALQRGIDRDVAVKILHRELSANPTVVARFNREAKVAARLEHPHVVHVLLEGQLPDGAMYIVMEYLDGLSLQSALAAAGGAFAMPRALHVAVALCGAAGEAHARGIVHRDLKPENVMLVTRGDDPDFVKVLDFGIARLNWGEQSFATAAGLIFGTARYISPEAARGEQVGPQADVYSIATMLYQMLSGRTPFEGDQVVALLVQQIHDPAPLLRGIERAAYVPEPIGAAIMKNLSKNPAQRADDARVFGKDLLQAALLSGLSAQDILVRPSMRAAAHTTSPGLTPKTEFGAPPDAGAATRSVARTEISDVTSRTPPPPSKPPSSVETTMADTHPPVQATQAARPSPLLTACALAGAFGIAVVAWKASPRALAGAIPPLPQEPTTHSTSLGAESTPAAPKPEPQLAPGSQTEPPEVPLPPLSGVKPAVVNVAGASRPSAAVPAVVSVATGSAAPTASIDALASKPAVGQPVDLVARVGGSSETPQPRTTEGARFHVAGPGIAGTDLLATDDGTGVYRTTFTFLQPGRFEVSFTARVDGGLVRASRIVAVDTTPSPSHAPAASSKWL
jgi:eukaryotic-like serine/threonine-protein kinase